VTQIEIDAATLARVIRELRALPITDDDADRLARALETSNDDEEFLANALSAIRFLVEQLEPSTPVAPEPTNLIG
jgi:Arc/MetJ family transcription regulator